MKIGERLSGLIESLSQKNQQVNENEARTTQLNNQNSEAVKVSQDFGKVSPSEEALRAQKVQAIKADPQGYLRGLDMNKVAEKVAAELM